MLSYGKNSGCEAKEVERSSGGMGTLKTPKVEDAQGCTSY
jgi:hypothetical protein